LGSTTFTIEQLEKLKVAYASGVLRVRLNEMEMVYQTSAEMLKAIRVMENELRTKKKASFIIPKFNSGL
jgi:hypothetical protein